MVLKAYARNGGTTVTESSKEKLKPGFGNANKYDQG